MLGPFMRITPTNLTGRYRLLLSRQVDYSLARRLLIVYQQVG